MKYERMKNNSTNSELRKNIFMALDEAMKGARNTLIRDFETEATKRMKAAGISADDIHTALFRYSRKLREGIQGINNVARWEFMR